MQAEYMQHLQIINNLTMKETKQIKKVKINNLTRQV